MARPIKFTAKAVYDFAADGGATGDISLANTEVIPNNAVIVSVALYTEAAVTSGGSATLQVKAGGIACTAAIAKATLSDESVNVDVAGAKATASEAIKVIVGTAAITAGKVNIFVDYFLQAAE